MVKTNSLHAWWLAARPKTLTGAAAPVIVALAAALSTYGQIDTPPALLCLFFALLMQTDANLVNDYFDCLHGVDTAERLGPERACAQGWITLPAMRRGLYVVTALACLTGLPLVAWGGWQCVAVGLACVAFCFLYTTLFSRIALGDVLVILFFGLCPVAYTFYLQHPLPSITDIPSGIWLLALAQGLVTDCLLLVNNFRDRDTDAAVGRTTLVTIIGARATLWLYGLIGMAACLLACRGQILLSPRQALSARTFIPLLFLPLHGYILYLLHTTNRGRALNRVLGMTAMSIFLFAILTALSMTH